MGTRSAVCEPHGDSYRGRYVHWDGYPTGVGARLIELVQRDGIEKVRQTIIHDHYGWSSLHQQELSPSYQDGRFVVVPDYGVAYVAEAGQVSEDEWITPGADYGTEWRYILADDGLGVLAGYSENPPRIATVPYSPDKDGLWTVSYVKGDRLPFDQLNEVMADVESFSDAG
jgi:hypothetical protein